ncbi:hypothetical protein LXA43DRAFT_984838, partial [Ganoderma leucocontextum]
MKHTVDTPIFAWGRYSNERAETEPIHVPHVRRGSHCRVEIHLPHQPWTTSLSVSPAPHPDEPQRVDALLPRSNPRRGAAAARRYAAPPAFDPERCDATVPVEGVAPGDASVQRPVWSSISLAADTTSLTSRSFPTPISSAPSCRTFVAEEDDSMNSVSCKVVAGSSLRSFTTVSDGRKLHEEMCAGWSNGCVCESSLCTSMRSRVPLGLWNDA